MGVYRARHGTVGALQRCEHVAMLQEPGRIAAVALGVRADERVNREGGPLEGFATKDCLPVRHCRSKSLGFTTQTAGRGEFATSALSLPRKFIRKDTVVHKRRPEAWRACPRRMPPCSISAPRGSTSQLSDDETLRKTFALFSEKGALRTPAQGC